jgi:hypothetical protein
MKFISHLHLVPRGRMWGAFFSRSLHAFMVWCLRLYRLNSISYWRDSEQWNRRDGEISKLRWDCKVRVHPQETKLLLEFVVPGEVTEQTSGAMFSLKIWYLISWSKKSLAFMEPVFANVRGWILCWATWIWTQLVTLCLWNPCWLLSDDRRKSCRFIVQAGTL